MASKLAYPHSRPFTAELLQSHCDLSMHKCSAGGTEVLIEGVLNEGMGEDVATGGICQLSYQGDGRSSVENVEQLLFRDPCGTGQHFEIEIPADDSRHRKHMFSGRSQASDSGTDHHAHTFGQSDLFGRTLRRPPSSGVLVDGTDL